MTEDEIISVLRESAALVNAWSEDVLRDGDNESRASLCARMRKHAQSLREGADRVLAEQMKRRT